MNPTFQREWDRKVRRIQSSRFWRQVSTPPADPIIRAPRRGSRDEVEVTSTWALASVGDLQPDGPARIGMEDLRTILAGNFGVRLRRRPGSADGPRVVFELAVPRPGSCLSRWDRAFQLRVEPGRIRVTGRSETALLTASVYLTNFWRLSRNPVLPRQRCRVQPLIPVVIGADLWGGFSTTQAWIPGRENDTNFLELARMGVNAVPVMTLIEDYIDEVPDRRFRSLVNPAARSNRERLARLARQTARYGVNILLMGYNPKLATDHRVFRDHPAGRGALQARGAFRTMCTSDPATRAFLGDAWASLIRDIPELGGIEAIIGGEGFYHCFMRSEGNRAPDCPRCSRRRPAAVVAELVNDVGRRVHAQSPEAILVAWPYSAFVWSQDRDHTEFARRLDPAQAILQIEIDKDSVDWRPAGYAKDIWDYSMSYVKVSERCRALRRLCARRRLPFSCKIECGNSIECLNVPYLPALENQRQIWENCRRLRPEAAHVRWLFDGSCKSPSEEMGYWANWGRGTEFGDLDRVLQAIAMRDFGERAAAGVRRAWRLFSEALRHHPALHYYTGSYFIGPGQPLCLSASPGESDLDPAFFGMFYWLWEDSSTADEHFFVKKSPLFFASPAFQIMARRGPNKGRDVGLQELQTMAALWERGARQLEQAGKLVPAACRRRFRQEAILGQHLAYTWRSAANVEEFLRLRDQVQIGVRSPSWRAGHLRENRRDLERMAAIAREELRIARADLALVGGVDYLDLSLRLDMGTASQEEILRAKIRQVRRLLARDLPALQRQLASW